MPLSLFFHDPQLLFIAAIAGVVSMLTTLNVAARPAAVQTGRVALAFTISAVFFMFTRFANLFYLPFLGAYVDNATSGAPGALDLLYYQIRFIVIGAATGALASWMMLPTFIELYRKGIDAMERHHSMPRVLLRFRTLNAWRAFLIHSPRRPSLLGVKLFKLNNQPKFFLVMNVLATAIWTVGTLCAALASAREKEYAQTAILLSGMVNAFALISFTIWVDPAAALITDQALSGQRPKEDVTVTAVHLAAGNFFGALLGLALLEPGTEWIQWLTRLLGKNTGSLSGSLWIVVAITCVVTLLQAAANMDRVSAVLTKRVATALAVYNVFFLVMNVSRQIYVPILGSLSDNAIKMNDPDWIEPAFRTVILGASLGVFLGILLMPTFVEIYCRTINAVERLGSFPLVLWKMIYPRSWVALFDCSRRPTLFGIRLADLKTLPNGFIWGNLLVVSITTVGQLAAINAGAHLEHHLVRTATLLSSVVNGVATIVLSIVVNPTAAVITDQCVAGERPIRHIYAMSVFLTVGMLAGTLLSQLAFGPATWVIGKSAAILDYALNLLPWIQSQIAALWHSAVALLPWVHR